MKISIAFLLLVAASQAIDYCFLDECLCDYNYISCSGFISYQRGTFQVPNPEAVRRIRFFNSVVYFLDFVFDFDNLEFLIILDSSINCTALEVISRKKQDMTIDAASTCSGKTFMH